MKGAYVLIVIIVAVGAITWYAIAGRSLESVPKISPQISESISPTSTITRTPTNAPTPAFTQSPLPTWTPTPILTQTPFVSPTPGLIFRETKQYLVSISGFSFAPSPLTVTQGDVVIFTNQDVVTHTVTSLNKLFDSRNIRSGDQWMLETANLTPGAYEYRCTPHPSMRGTIAVEP